MGDFNKFHNEYSLVVSSSDVDFIGARVFMQNYVKELLPRGDSSSTRILILSGSHGFADGKDALCSLEGLTSLKDGMVDQTRRFYKDWCKLFKLQMEGEDPRVYDQEDGKVVDVKDEKPPVWEEEE